LSGKVSLGVRGEKRLNTTVLEQFIERYYMKCTCIAIPFFWIAVSKEICRFLDP